LDPHQIEADCLPVLRDKALQPLTDRLTASGRSVEVESDLRLSRHRLSLLDYVLLKVPFKI
jgi:hypothetical protein